MNQYSYGGSQLNNGYLVVHLDRKNWRGVNNCMGLHLLWWPWNGSTRHFRWKCHWKKIQANVAKAFFFH